MLRRHHRRRAGFSLVEVLVALFIVAAGLIALLTLFPLGAVQMGRALQDDRSQQTALQADGKLRELWRARVVEPALNPADPYFKPTESYYSALNYHNDPDGGVGTATGSQPAIGNGSRPSYPVLIDPIGVASYTGLKRDSVANGNVFLRRTYPAAAGFGPAVRAATLPDDMEFGPLGTPANGEGLSVRDPATVNKSIFRAGRYNWAAVIQRPDNSRLTVADLKILVFDRRTPGVNPPDNELPYAIPNVTPGQTQLVFPASNDVLGFRVDSWIMDGTISATIRNANFYRITNVDADTFPGQTLVELHIPIQPTRGEATPTAAYDATFYVFRELIDVYDRPQLAPSDYRKQTP